MEALRPCVVQVSGGEPLMRPDDIVEIVRSIKAGAGIPYTILVSNWSQMTEQKYLALREAGIDQFSVSLDFPDERHDEFRRLPGLYQRLSELMPRLAELGHDDIVLNSCITSRNLPEINRLADKAREWGVNLCYSAYSQRRTGCRDLFLNSAEELADFSMPNSTVWKGAATTPTGSSTRRARSKPPAGTLQMAACPAARPACASWWCAATARYSLARCSSSSIALEDRERMIEEFTNSNTCDECYVSIRSYLDKSFPQLLKENVAGFFSFKTERN